MIHYISSATALFDWMRDEERLFLRWPERALACWNGAVFDIASAVGLDDIRARSPPTAASRKRWMRSWRSGRVERNLSCLTCA